MIEGDVRFGAGVVVKGHVRLVNIEDRAMEIPDGSVLDGNT